MLSLEDVKMKIFKVMHILLRLGHLFLKLFSKNVVV